MTIPGTFVEVRDFFNPCLLIGSAVICLVFHVFIILTSLCQVEMPGSALLYKEGFVLRKNIMEGPHKKGKPCMATLRCA